MINSPGCFDLIYSTRPHATVVFGLIDGLILGANDAALALYGYTREELVGMKYALLSAEPDVKVHKRKDGSKLMVEFQHSTESVEGREVGVSVIRPLPA